MRIRGSLIFVIAIIMSMLSRYRAFRAFRGALRTCRSVSSQVRMSGWNAVVGDINVDHLEVPNTKISAYWLDKLKKVEKVTAHRAISGLTPDNVLGYKKGEKSIFDKGTMMGYAIEQKAKHPDKIVLVRIGDFYETYGLDAIILCNHAGLNLMKSDIKAGCPWRNVQQTLDSLTESGFSVVIYEEISEVDAGPGPSGKPASKMKNRAQSFIVTPGRRTYPHALTLKRDLEEFPADRPYIGIKGSPSSGYFVVEISLEDKRVTPHSRLNEEAVRTILDAAGAVHPIYCQDVDRSQRQQLLGQYASLSSGEVETLSDYSERDFTDIVLRMVCLRNGIDEATMATFRTIVEPSSERPRHLYSSTAYQIGLKPNPNIPDLISCLLDKNHKAHSARFLREWLSSPPPKEIARHMQNLCRTLHDNEISLPSNAPFIIRKVLTLLDSRQCNANVFREIADCATATTMMLEQSLDKGTGTGDKAEAAAAIVTHLLEVVSHRAGTLRIDPQELLDSSRRLTSLIAEVVASDDDAGETSATGDVPTGHAVSGATGSRSESASLVQELLNEGNADVLRDFFAASEGEFRGHVVRSHPEMEEVSRQLEEAAAGLVRAIASEYPVQEDPKESKLTFKNGKVYLLKEPSAARARDNVEYKRPYDEKKQKYLGGSTTKGVAAAVAAYLEVAERAPGVVERILQGLCVRLDELQMTIVLISNWALVLQAASSHVRSARQRGWALPTLVEYPEEGGASVGTGRPSFDAAGLSAWWMERSDPSTKLNRVSLDGIFLLTAPNMSGKSTIMRAILAAALLANAGLFVPCESGAQIPFYDSFFLRTSSYDVPSEGKSSFALEMDDMRVVLRDSTTRSLVMIDELGRGTSSRDGSALAGAILEALDQRYANGVFATHLHEITTLPLSAAHITYKKMRSSTDPATGRVTWDYTMEDGLCTDSMALETAKEFRIDEAIIRRAQQLQASFDEQCRGGGRGADGEESPSSEQALPLRKAEEDFYLSALGMESGLDPSYTHAQLSTGMSTGTELGGTLSEAYERQDVEQLLRMTMSMQEQRGEEKHDEQKQEQEQGQGQAQGSYSLDDVLPVVHSLAGTKKGVALFEESFDPPASLEGHSCVYLLLVRKAGSPDAFYVGETETIGARVQAHRTKTFKGARVQGAVVKAPNKSTARLMETRIIGSLKRSGYLVLNDSDGAHANFGGAKL